MHYLTESSAIRNLISQLTTASTLWLDTEIADWWTRNKKLSLIQVSADANDPTGDSVYLLDVLNKPDVVAEFRQKIIANPLIEKVFHNAAFDLRFLGRDCAQNVTCTLKIARQLTLEKLGTPNRKLKTLAATWGNFDEIDTESQSSDWGQRPLYPQQLQYAKMDVVYLACVHRHLLNLTQPQNIALPTLRTSQSFPAFSVTKVRVAFECPRLFYLGHRRGSTTIFIPPGKVRGVGNEFHKWADKFVQIAHTDARFHALFRASFADLKVKEVAQQMQQLFYQLAFYPYLETISPEKASILLQTWQGLTHLIERWAELLVKNRRYCQADEVIFCTLINSTPDVEFSFTLPDNSQQKVRGKFDSLVYDFEEHRLCVVEYKTYVSPDKSAQLAQVALYSYMLREQLGVDVNSAVYSVLPSWEELTFSWEELESTVHQLIPHKLQQMRDWANWEEGDSNPPPPTTQPYLCEICPQQQLCQTLFVETEIDAVGYPQTDETAIEIVEETEPLSPTAETPEITPPLPQNTDIDAEAIGQQLVEVLRAFRVDVDYVGAVVGTAFIRVKLRPNLGVKVASILKLSADLQVQMACVAPPMIATQPGYVSVDLPRPNRQIAWFNSFICREKMPNGAPVRIAIGIDLDGKLIEADLSDPNTCHFLVGGTTGSGKSEFLRSLLLSLLYRYTPDQLKIVLVDPKRVTFPEFESMPWLWSPVVKKCDRAVELMEQLVVEMERRYQRFEMVKCSDLDTYNQTQAQPLPHLVCIFDEYADFMAEKEIRDRLEQSIKRLGAMARAAGIHLIISTQRPEANVVTPIIRSNLPGRIALRTASEADSRIVLGGNQGEAANLLGKGDLLYVVGSKQQRLQSLYAAEIQY